MLTNLDLLNMLARDYERKHINDTDDYKHWLLYGFACASFGDDGLNAFLLFSRSSTKYCEAEAKKQFKACVKAYKGEKNSLKNILALLRNCGIMLKELLQGRTN